jgi:hypothetical protein
MRGCSRKMETNPRRRDVVSRSSEGSTMAELGSEIAADFCGQFRPVPVASDDTIRFDTLRSLVVASSGVIGGPYGHVMLVLQASIPRLSIMALQAPTLVLKPGPIFAPLNSLKGEEQEVTLARRPVSSKREVPAYPR